MKPVKGRIASSKPISLSKAARVLAQFVATDATLPLSSSSSQAVSAYLRRASASFDELIQFHRDLKSSKSHGVDGSNTKQIPTEDAVYNGGSPSAAAAAPNGPGVVGGIKNKRKKGREMREERDNVDVVNSNHIKYESSERKKREKVVVEDDLDEQNDSSRRKKKKKKRRED